MKLFVEEDGSIEALSLWDQADEVVSAGVVYVEARAAIARRLAGRRAEWARGELAERWRAMQAVTVDDPLLEGAGELADNYRLRALDALHLAAAVRVRDEGLVFATWDEDLRRAARNEGFVTAPL